jgi:hypothetical protein
LARFLSWQSTAIEGCRQRPTQWSPPNAGQRAVTNRQADVKSLGTWLLADPQHRLKPKMRTLLAAAFEGQELDKRCVLRVNAADHRMHSVPPSTELRVRCHLLSNELRVGSPLPAVLPSTTGSRGVRQRGWRWGQGWHRQQLYRLHARLGGVKLGMVWARWRERAPCKLPLPSQRDIRPRSQLVLNIARCRFQADLLFAIASYFSLPATRHTLLKRACTTLTHKLQLTISSRGPSAWTTPTSSRLPSHTTSWAWRPTRFHTRAWIRRPSAAL